MGRYPRDWIAVSVIAALLIVAAAEFASRAGAVSHLEAKAQKHAPSAAVTTEWRWD